MAESRVACRDAKKKKKAHISVVYYYREDIYRFGEGEFDYKKKGRR